MIGSAHIQGAPILSSHKEILHFLNFLKNKKFYFAIDLFLCWLLQKMFGHVPKFWKITD